MKLLYDYWFTQFDFPNQDGKAYKSSNGNMVYSEELKCNIPLDWKVTTLDQLINFLSGFSFSSDLYSQEGMYKLLTIKNVQDTGINTNVDNFIQNPPYNVPDYCYLKPKDILLSLTGNVGRIGIIYTDNCLLNQRVCLLEPKNKQFIPYVYCLMKSEKIRKSMEVIAGGSSQKNLSPIETGKILVPYNEKVVSHFSSLYNTILDTIVKNLYENEKLYKLRDWLLPILMNGQATIED